jgi:hypothetical protein
MLYVRQPTQDEKQELERMLRQEVGRVTQRAHMIQLIMVVGNMMSTP